MTRPMTIGASMVVLAALALPLGGSSAGLPELPAYGAPQRVIWLDQNWSAAERQNFHYASQGAATIPVPYKWFLAIEQPEPFTSSPGLFSDPAYLDRFGFIPSPANAGNNPDGLPIGLTRASGINPATGKPFDELGFTCAACHTGRIEYRGTRLLIDGGPAMTDVGKFRESLGYALGLTAAPLRFKRFADRVLGRNHSLGARLRLKGELLALIKEGIDQQKENRANATSLVEGVGRVDALARIGNEVFASQMRQPANYAPLSAPVNYPHLWDTSWYDWVQYNGSIEQPMVRNAGEAMGVRALVNFLGTATPRFTSTVPIDKIHLIEEALAGKEQPTKERKFTGLRSPRWPAEIFGAADRKLADEGEALYDRHCSSCHLPSPNSKAFWESPRWLAPNRFGQRYLNVTMVPVDRIGTDPAQADDMQKRTVRVPLAFGLKDAVGTRGSEGVYPYGWALGQVVEKVISRWYDSHGVPEAERQRLNGFRPNGIRAGIGPGGRIPAYKARPLNGIWATAPFLHNGSVPTLYDLLSPYDERPKSFWLGNREFDPVRVGYLTGPIKGGFQLVAVDRNGRPARGNFNGGHLFETPADPARPRAGTIGPTLTPRERSALIEFLKTL